MSRHKTTMTVSILALLLALIMPATIATADQSALSNRGTPGEDAIIHLKYNSFNPQEGEPNVPSTLRAVTGSTVRLVHLTGPLTSAEIKSIELSGVRLIGYIPDYTYLAVIQEAALPQVRALSTVKWIGDYHPAYKIHSNLLEASGSEIELNVLFFKELVPSGSNELLKAKIAALGGTITADDAVHPLLQVKIDPSRIEDLARLPEIHWIEQYYPPKTHMNFVRQTSGGQFAQIAEFDGSGIVGEVKDSGIEWDHPDLVNNLFDTDGNIVKDSHGTHTFGIVFSDAASDTSSARLAKGMMPGGTGIFCSYNVNRRQSVDHLKTNWNGRFQSNSWSQVSAGEYLALSAWNDLIINDFDVSMLYSAGNDGVAPMDISSDAVSKNTIGVGAVTCGNNDDRSDDRWILANAGNTPGQGPAADGRIKPDLVSHFDDVFCTDILGGGGSWRNDYYPWFGGTSASCPIVAGCAGLTYQMYEENHFGNNPGGEIPHTETVKAILIANAHQYPFDRATRFQQGWGFADVGRVNAAHRNMFIENGENPLQTGQTWSTQVMRYTGHDPLKISLVWADVDGNPSASIALVNDLDLRVTAPNGVVFRGNVGLVDNLYSTGGGSFDRLNNVENVFIQRPLAGNYTIEVVATNVAMDHYDDTPAVDQEFALVATMVNLNPVQPAIVIGPGPDDVNDPLVRTFNAADGRMLFNFSTYGVDEYGVNVATGDLEGTGVDLIITGPGPGRVFGPHVRAFTKMGHAVSPVSFLAYGTNKYGVNVAAGDIDGDGYDEIVTGAGPGQVFGPHVRGWNYDNDAITSISQVSFLSYGTNKWGVNVACGDIDGDGSDEIITGAGPGAVFGPHVRGWNYDGAGRATAIPGVSYLAYGTPKWGVKVACGDIDGDGIDEIITGPGPGGSFGAQVRAANYDGSNLTQMDNVNFFAYSPSEAMFGVSVATLDLDGDGFDEIITAPGPDPATTQWLKGWNVDGGSVTPIGDLDFNAYPDHTWEYGGTVAGGNF